MQSKPELLTAHDMIDMAFGTPDFGILNLGMLHSLLHVIIHKMDLDSYRIELDSACIETYNANKEPFLFIKEFKISDSNNTDQRKPVKKDKSNADVKRILSLICPACINDDQEVVDDELQELDSVHYQSESSLNERIPYYNESETGDIIKKPQYKNKHQSNSSPSDNTMSGTSNVNTYTPYFEEELDVTNKPIHTVSDEIERADPTVSDNIESILNVKENTSKNSDHMNYNDSKLQIIEEDPQSAAKRQKQELRQINFETIFYTSLAEIQDMIDAKLDKCAINNLVRFLENKLSLFEEEIRKINDFLNVPESAGGCCTVIRNLNCICCSQPSNLRVMECPQYVPLMRSAKPSGNRQISRYCGGDHTKVSPPERVLHRDTFFKQFKSIRVKTYEQYDNEMKNKNNSTFVGTTGRRNCSGRKISQIEGSPANCIPCKLSKVV